MICNIDIDKCNENEWTDCLLKFDDASIYQTWTYGAVRWGENNLSHCVIKNNDEVIGLAQVAIKKLPGFKAGIAYIPWGPLWRRKGHPANVEHIDLILNYLLDEYVKNRGLLLRVTPNVFENSVRNINNVFEKHGFKKSASMRCYRTFRLNLEPSLDDLRKQLNQKWRNMLNQSEKKGLQVIEGCEENLYETFLHLQKEMQERKNYLPGVDYREFGEIQAALPDPLKMRIMICKSEEEPVSAAVVSAIGNTGIYLLGATGNKGMQLKGSYLLQWRFIKWLKEKGCKWYDLGGINPDDNPGVYRFKAGISGDDVSFVGQYEMCRNRLSSLVVLSGELLRGAKRHLNRRFKK